MPTANDRTSPTRESTRDSTSTVVTTEAPAVPEIQVGDLINNRYRMVRKLGRGGMGAVFLVQDEWQIERLLAMKRVRRDRLDQRTITILRNEFIALSTLNHPNLARVYDFEVDFATQDFFFTSEFFEGSQLLKAARELQIGRKGDLLGFLETLVQILRALEFIHSRGLVHGDIKPENILLSGNLSREGAEGSLMVKMIDFGLTKKEKEFGGKKILGTTYYIAPETILGSQIDRRTDLYSLGVVLYHLVTKKLPFTGESNLAVMRGHIEKIPVPPSRVNPEVPEPLDRIILRLMEKTPSDRYGSAMEIIEAVNAEFSTSFPLETLETQAGYIRSGGFIARNEELSALLALFDAVFHVEGPPEVDEDLNLPSLSTLTSVVAPDEAPPPRGRMVLLRGESGVGRRRLIDEFRRYAQTRGIHCIEIDCQRKVEGRRGADASRRTFTELVHALVSVLSARYPGGMPDPASLEGFFDTVDKAASELRSLGPVVDKLAGKTLESCRRTPLVLALHNLPCADGSTLEFVKALVEKSASGAVPEAQLVIAATADDDDANDARLRILLGSPSSRQLIRELHLRRLNTDEVSQLLGSMFGVSGGKCPFPDRLVQVIQEESDGNPGVVREILEHLASGGRIRKTLEGWVSEGAIERDAIPGKVRHDLRCRIDRLDPAAKRLASALSVLGSSSELEVAVRLAGLPPGQIFNAIWALKQEKIIREGSGDGGAYSFIHSSARDILYEDIPETERPALHERAGSLLENHLRSQGKDDPRRLAYHFLRSQNAPAALRHGLAAAREYSALYHPRKAIEVFTEVRRFAAAQGAVQGREIDRAIARLHFHIGEYRAASEILRGLLGQDGRSVGDMSESERASILIEVGEASCRLGKFREGAGCFNEALRILKSGGATPVLSSLLLGYADLYHLRGNFSESLRYCERVLSWEKTIQETDLENRLYLLLAENHFRLDNKEIAIKYCQKGLELLESKRDIATMALTLLYLGKFYKYKGRFQKALKQFQLCASVNQKISAADRQADCLREMGAVHLFLENPEEAQGQLSGAIGLYEKTENVAGLIETLNLRGDAYRILGRYEDSRKDLERALQANTAVTSSQNATESYLACGRIAVDQGHLKNAVEYFEEAARGDEGQLDERSTLRNLALRCNLEVLRGRFGEALDLAARGIIAGRAVGNRMRIAPLLEQRIRLYILLGKGDEVRRSLSSLHDIAARYGLPVLEGRACLLEGMLANLDKKPDEAEKAFERSLRIFRETKSERDLVNGYLESGRYALSVRNHEQAYLLLEEGLYLAKKLNLAQDKCLFYHAMGLLEATLNESEFERAEGYFTTAERFARTVPYPDALWRIRNDLGRFYLAAGRVEHADRMLTEGLKSLRALIQEVPEPFRTSYLDASGRADLEAVQAEVQARAEVLTRKTRVKYPARDPGQDEYFGLLGRAARMKQLFKELSELPPDVPWVWICGAPGSGRREVACAIHRQSSPERQGIWTYASTSFHRPELEEFIAAMEKARTPAPAQGEQAKAQEMSPVLADPGRFSLVIPDFSELEPEIQKFILDWILAEQDAPDGLRVLATLDRPLEAIQAPEGGGECPILAEILEQNFPVIRVPSLSEHPEDLGILVKHFLQVGRKSAEGPAPRLTAEGMDMVRKLPFLDQVRDVRSLCDKIRRFGGLGESIGAEAIRTILTPTLKIARRK